MSLRLLSYAIAATCLAACSSIPPYAAVEPEPARVVPFELPLRTSDAGALLVTLESSVGPLDLIVDTGADQPLLLRPRPTWHGTLPVLGREWSGRASGAVARRLVLGLAELQVGPLRFTDVAATLDDSTFPPFLASDGMLGRRLLDGFTLDFDAPGGRLGVLPGGTLPADVTAEPDAWPSFPIDTLQDGPVVVATLNDDPTPRRLVLDTGAIAFEDDRFLGIIELPTGIAPTDAPPDSPPVVRAVTLHLGSATLGPFDLFVIDHPQPPGTHGFLGNVLFATHRVVVDSVNRMVHVRASD